MSELQVGDKVEVVNSTYELNGSIATVVSSDGSGNVRVEGDNGNLYWYAQEYLKPVVASEPAATVERLGNRLREYLTTGDKIRYIQTYRQLHPVTLQQAMDAYNAAVQSIPTYEALQAEVARLEAKNAALKDALMPFAKIAMFDGWNTTASTGSNAIVYQNDEGKLTRGDFDAALIASK